jgi:hypothetical protein
MKVVRDMSEPVVRSPGLRPVAFEPVCEQVVDTHVVIVDVLRDTIGKVPAPVHRGGLMVWCTAEVDLGPRHLSETKIFGLNCGGELDVWGVLGDACRRRPSGRRLIGVGILPPSAPQPPRRPFVGSGGAGLMPRLRDSRFLRYGAALVGSSDHLRTGTVEVRGCAPHSASDLVDGTSYSAL